MMFKLSTKSSLRVALVTLIALTAHHAQAQSLYLSQDEQNTTPDASQPVILLEEVSLHFISAPETRVIKKHDIITIIIDENSSQTSSQSLNTKKESNSQASIDALVDLMQLLELRLRSGDTTNTELIDLTNKRRFKGEGDYERSDRFSARITAKVLEVKPNGTLVLEATKRIAKDQEISVLVLSGLAREEDVTAQNTILSSQLADLTIILENEGSLKDVAEKGLITRVLDSIFAF